MSPCSSWSGETVGRLQVHFELWSNRIREAYLTLPKCHAADKNGYKSVFIHCIISSGETILTAYRRTGTRTHVYADYTQLHLQPTLPHSKQGLEVEEDSSGAGNMAGLLFWKKKMSWCLTEGVQRGFLSERKGKVIYCRGAEDRKGAGTNSEESGTRHLEAESIRSRSESTGGCVNLKPVSVKGIKSDSGCHGLRVEWFPNTLRYFLAGNWQQIWNKDDY